MKYKVGDKVTVSPYAVGDPKAPNHKCWATVVGLDEDDPSLGVNVEFVNLQSDNSYPGWYHEGHLVPGHLPDPEGGLGLLEKERAVLRADPTARRRDENLARVFGAKTPVGVVNIAQWAVLPRLTQIPKEYGGGMLGHTFRYGDTADYMPVAWGDYKDGVYGDRHQVWASNDGCFWLVGAATIPGTYRGVPHYEVDGIPTDITVFAGDADTAPDVRIFKPKAILQGFRFKPE